MFVDASAVIAILNREAGYESLAASIDQAADGVTFCPIVRFEAVLGLARARSLGRTGRTTPEILAETSNVVQLFLDRVGTEEIDVTSEMGHAAIEASSKFGKAVGHPADLKFGDCFICACARARNETLLFIGDDFTKTDAERAVVP